MSYSVPFLFCATLVTDVCWETSEPHQNIWITLKTDCKPSVCCAQCCVVALWGRRKDTCCLWTMESWPWRLNDKRMEQPFLRSFLYEWHTYCFTSSAVVHWLLYIVFKGLHRAKWHVLKTTVLSASRGLVWFALRRLIIMTLVHVM